MAIANRYRMQVVEVGTVHLQINITIQNKKVLIKNVVLNDVLYVPESKESLFSVPCLTDRGLKIEFDYIRAVITEQHGVEGIPKTISRMYVI